MAEMSEELKQKLRGRPKKVDIPHTLIQIQDKEAWSARLAGERQSSGLSCLRKWFSGVVLKPRDAIRAKCADCSCYYADGMRDCENPRCPLYYYMPYRKKAK